MLLIIIRGEISNRDHHVLFTVRTYTVLKRLQDFNSLLLGRDAMSINLLRCLVLKSFNKICLDLQYYKLASETM